ncbi:MAG: hypothetical protein LBF41_03435 [Deltaproteobacteria bacterium]|jgi:hypothetical protein|nr:hypothetical protein [Deltaproteobacteria bacterium]
MLTLLKFGDFSLYLSGLSFHEGGEIKSLTLWPNEDMTVEIGGKPVRVGPGIAFHEDGSVKSVEPKKPVPVDTPWGPMEAFDPCAIGVTGELNSLRFDRDGKVSGLKSLAILEAKTAEGTILLKPLSKPNPTDDSRMIHAPLDISFEDGKARVRRGELFEKEIWLDLADPVKLIPHIAHKLVTVKI